MGCWPWRVRRMHLSTEGHAQEPATLLAEFRNVTLNEEENDMPTLVPLNTTFHNGVPCGSERGARIEQLAEPHACEAAFVVHAPTLCAHPQLAPPAPREPQVISCVANNAENVNTPSEPADNSDRQDDGANFEDRATLD